MGMLETSYEIAGLGGVMVGSEQTEPWDGWPYNTFLDDLADDPGMTPNQLATSIVTRYGQRLSQVLGPIGLEAAVLTSCRMVESQLCSM